MYVHPESESLYNKKLAQESMYSNNVRSSSASQVLGSGAEAQNVERQNCSKCQIHLTPPDILQQGLDGKVRLG
jgi:hypothetical protein